MPTITKQSAKPAKTATSVGRGKDAAGRGGSAWDTINKLRVLVYGQSGTGKTTFCATFPSPILWLVCSGGNNPGELRSIDTAENRKRIKAEIVYSSNDFRDLVGQAAGFETVVLDHATGFADLLLKEILGLDELPAQKGWGLAQQSQYGQLALQCKESFRALLNLPCNTVIIAQERTFGDDSANSDIIKPTIGAALTPSVTGWLGPAVDFVLQTFKRQRMEETVTKVAGKEIKMVKRGVGVEYCVRTGPHDLFQTKFRVPKGTPLPDCVVDFDYNKLVQVIAGEYVG